MIRDPITLVSVRLPPAYGPLNEAYAHLDMRSLLLGLFALQVSPLAHVARHEIESIRFEFHRRSTRN